MEERIVRDGGSLLVLGIDVSIDAEGNPHFKASRKRMMRGIETEISIWHEKRTASLTPTGADRDHLVARTISFYNNQLVIHLFLTAFARMLRE